MTVHDQLAEEYIETALAAADLAKRTLLQDKPIDVEAADAMFSKMAAAFIEANYARLMKETHDANAARVAALGYT